MTSLKSIVQKNPADQEALISASYDRIIMKKSFGFIVKVADQLELLLAKHMKEHYGCVGLLMDQNFYVPSIIICLQNMNTCFTFLTSEAIEESCKLLNIKWILSFEKTAPLNHFELKDTLTAPSTPQTLFLWFANVHETGNVTFKDIFCVVQTSGSTGDQKIIRVPYKCIQSNVESLNKHFQVTTKDLIYWGTPLTFDPSLVEVLLGLIFGSKLLIAPKKVRLNPSFLYKTLFEVGQVTFLQMVPSVFLGWSKAQISQILLNSSLRVLALGGEEFPNQILEHQKKLNLQIFNLYGVTELSCWATVADLTSHSSHQDVPLGLPLDDTFLDLNDSEICIGSHTRYCLTDSSETVSKIVKTGDLGELREGVLYYLGRKSRIVKRFGHKVVLYKLEETVLNKLGLQCRMVYHSMSNKLLAFVLIEVMPDEKTKVRMLDKIRVKILSILPEHALPDYFQIISQFPVNHHGKLCDKSLIKLYQDGQSVDKRLGCPEQALIQILSTYLRTNLKNSDELKEHTFMELGGNSIMTLQVLQAFEEQIGAKAPDKLVTVLMNETIQDCINFVTVNATGNAKRLIQQDITPLEVKKPKPNLSKEYVLWTYNLLGCVDSPPLAFHRESTTYIAASSFANRFVILRDNGQEYFTHVFPKEVAAQPVLSQCGAFMFIGCTDGVMYCLDLEQKMFVWEYRTMQEIKSSACVCDGVVVFGSYDNCVYGLKMDGSLLWKTPVSGHIKADLLYNAELNSIYIGTTKGFAYCLNGIDGIVLWFSDLQQPIFSTPCLVDHRIVWATVGGKFFVGDCGSELKGQIEGHIFSSLKPNNRNSAAYFGSHNSRLYRLHFENHQVQIVNIIQLESKISSTPFVYEFCDLTFVICACNTGVVYVVNGLTNSIILRKQLPDASFSSPYVFDKKIYIGCRDNNLYCIDIGSVLLNNVS